MMIDDGFSTVCYNVAWQQIITLAHKSLITNVSYSLVFYACHIFSTHGYCFAVTRKQNCYVWHFQAGVIKPSVSIFLAQVWTWLNMVACKTTKLSCRSPEKLLQILARKKSHIKNYILKWCYANFQQGVSSSYTLQLNEFASSFRLESSNQLDEIAPVSCYSDWTINMYLKSALICGVIGDSVLVAKIQPMIPIVVTSYI